MIDSKIHFILRAAQRILCLAFWVKTNRVAIDQFEVYQRRIKLSFLQFADQTKRLGWPSEKIINAQYALAAYVDEVVLASNWMGKLTWVGNPLQLDFFGERLAGEHFFERLEKLLISGAKEIDALMIYYICLQLGFKGKYRFQSIEPLVRLKEDLNKKIQLSINEKLKSRIITPPSSQAAYKHFFEEHFIQKIFLLTIGIIIFSYGIFFTMSFYEDTQKAAQLHALKSVVLNPLRDSSLS
jgi:type IV/VI secretion system ImpK/VasF family protein